MTNRRQGKSDINQNEQRILNWSFDEIFQVLVNLGVKMSPAGDTATASLDREITEDLAMQMVDVGAVSYIGEARVGEDTSDNVWRVKKLDQTSGLVITWADGNSEFDNIFDNYASLSYS